MARTIVINEILEIGDQLVVRGTAQEGAGLPIEAEVQIPKRYVLRDDLTLAEKRAYVQQRFDECAPKRIALF
jgi:hypothetical protein